MTRKTLGIIFAAGKGTRMAPLTDTLPKPLAPVRDSTLLEIILEKSAPLVDEFVLTVSYLKEQIIDKIGYNFAGKKVTYAVQENPKSGTWDAFRAGIFADSKFQNYNYFVTCGDNLLSPQIYQDLRQAFLEDPDQAFLVAKQILDKNILKSMGVFETDEFGNFLKIVEKPQEFVSDLTNIGTYYFPNKVLEFVSKQKPKTVQNSIGNTEELITDMFNQYSQKYPIKLLPTTAAYYPISTVQDLKLAETQLSSFI